MMHRHHHSHSPFHHLAREERSVDLVHILDPAYRPSTTSTPSSPNKNYTDLLGNVHDSEYKLFPTDEWKRQHHRQHRHSFEMRKSVFLDDSEDEDQDDEADYAFGGKKSRRRSFNNQLVSSSHPAGFPSPPPPSPTHGGSFSHRVHSNPKYAHSELLLSKPTFTSPFGEAASPIPIATTTLKKATRRKRCRGKSNPHYWHDEDADSDVGDEVPSIRVSSVEEQGREKQRPETKERSQEDNEDDLSFAPNCLSISKGAIRRRWQYLQLSLRLAVFRAERRWRRRVSVAT